MNKSAATPTVLVIADDLKLVESLRGAFGSACQVFLSPSVEAGLRRVEHENLAAVLINMGLRGLNAQATVDAIRAARGDAVTLVGFTPSPDKNMPVIAGLRDIAGCQMVPLPVDWKDLRGLLENQVPIVSQHPTFPSQVKPSPQPSPEPTVEATPPRLVLPPPAQLSGVPLSVEASTLLENEASLAEQQAAASPANHDEAARSTIIPFPSPPRLRLAETAMAPVVPESPISEELAEDSPASPQASAELPHPDATDRLPQEAPILSLVSDAIAEQGIASSFLRDEALLIESANRFEAVNAEGTRVTGRILRVSPHFVVCEVLNPMQVLPPGWLASEATVHLGQQEAYRGPTRLAKVVNTGRSLICEWALQGKWQQVSPNSSASVMPHIAGSALAPFFERVTLLARISEVFKATIADVASLLEEAQQCLDRIEISHLPQPGETRAQAHRALLLQMQQSVFPAFDAVFARLEKVAVNIPADLDAEYHSLVRQHLHPLMMCAPFIHHIYAKPLGFAGDYGALHKLLDDPYEGHTLFAKLLNAWLVLTPAGEAYRTRIHVLENELHEQAVRCHVDGTDLRVLSIGAGAANEVVSFLGANDLCNSAELTLVDFNRETLDFAKRQVEDAMREHWRLTRINFVRMSIQGLIMDESRMKRKGASSHGPIVKAGGYDFIYCTGLFDYFSDRVCKRLLGAMYTMLAPGGKLLVCNFTPANPIRHFMKYVLDWDLTHRTADELRNLTPDGILSTHCHIEHSPENVEAYLHIIKPA